ncbi:hypothetical protein ASD08_42710 [Streptomyces sp. Root369]|nr:hypothetical protein ASD08_42710 [Streptomyces sp. Root369]
MSREATASSICRIEPAPTRGAVTTGWRRSQASAICARLTPWASAARPTASMMAWLDASCAGE